MRKSKIKFFVKLIALAIVLFAFVSVKESNGQAAWTSADYNKALWMTTRFYGGQRSGTENWLLYNHLPSGVDPSLRGLGHRADFNQTDNVDLSGGWNDCGDHVKFGQTQFYAAYLLIKGYTEFKTGYDDKYAYNYNGYKTSGQWNYEGTGHAPNCIPDVLDEMKHETDFLIKCAPNSSTFWFQVGDGGGSADHCQRVTAVKSQTYAVNCGGNNDNGIPGTRRPSCKNPNDGMMASLAAAALAVMAREYQSYDPVYAALCLTHAQYAYTYASTRLGSTVGTCFGGFYGAPAVVNATNAYVCAASELFTTTGTVSYQTTANGLYATVAFNGGWSFDYANIGELALYCLAENGHAAATTAFNNRITGHYLAAGSRNAAGVYTAYGTWGRLRYNGNAAFLISLYSKLNNNVTAGVINAIHNDVDYIMGKNASNRTYIVGFAPAAGSFTTPLYPHHRNAFLDDNNVANATNLPLPAKNAQMGALVGGQRDGTYTDSWQDYVNSEVCIDYNAGLVGALGFINARLAPVTLSCGANACQQPNIGVDRSTCIAGLFPLTLTDANTGSIPAGVTYTWKRVLPTPITTPIGTAGATAKSRVIAAGDCPSFPCKIVVVRDSTYTLPSPGTCTKTDTVTITNSIPVPNLGGDPAALCSVTSYNLLPSNAASFPGGTTWQWAADFTGGTTYNNIVGETASTLANVRRVGRYRLTATAGSCTNNDNVVITSSLPTPVDGCIASGPGTATLAITNPGLIGTNYNWYTTPSGSTIIPGGTGVISVTSPSVSTTTTYYVQDMSAVNGNVGPTTMFGATQNWGCATGHSLLFTATSNFTLKSLFLRGEYFNSNPASFAIQILNSANTVVATFTTDPNTTHPASGESLQKYTFNSTLGVLIDQASWGSNLQMKLSGSCTDVTPRWTQGGASFPYVSAGSIVTITNANTNGSVNTSDYIFFHNWEISTGSSCSRLPVVLQVGGACITPVSLIGFYAEKQTTSTMLNWITATEKNNNYFEVERSLDGVNFEKIGQLAGAGNSSNATIYNFEDKNSYSTRAYYRLAQYDFDGALEYSYIISVEHESILAIQVAPNPFNSSVELIVKSATSQKATVSIVDLSGHPVFESTINTNSQVLLGENLSAGVYLLQIRANNEVKTLRIVKQ